MMVILITFVEKDERTGREEILVSHGIDDNLRPVVIPPVPPSQIGYFDAQIGEWILHERFAQKEQG